MFHRSLLPNGIRIVSETIPGARSVSIGIVLDASPHDEPDQKGGLAHLTEHGLFLGTSSRGAADISRTIDEAGGQMGAFTGRDYTCLHANIMADYYPFALDLFGDLLVNSTFPEDRLATQKDAVIHEINMCSDDPMQLVHDTLRRNVWSGHRLGRSVAGSLETVSKLTRQDVVDFAASHYVPGRMIVAAAGAIDHEVLVSQTRDAFWEMDGQSPYSRPSTECPFGSSFTIDEGPSKQSYFAIAMPAPSWCSEQRYAVYALNVVLGDGLSSRLFSRVRDELGMVFHIGSSYFAYRDAGLLTVEGVTQPDMLRDAVEVVKAEISKVADEGVTEEELWRARMQLRGQHLLSADSPHTRMSRIATQEYYFGRFVEESEVLAAIDRLDLQTVREVAGAVLDADCACAVVGPETSETNSGEISGLLLSGAVV